MSLLRKAAVFVVKEFAKELASQSASKLGEHIGDALGNIVGKKIDPEHGKMPADEDGKK